MFTARYGLYIIQISLCQVLVRPEGYVPLLPISFLEGKPREVQADLLALGVDEFHRPRHRPAVTAPTTTRVLSPLPLGLSTKLKFLAQYTLL